MLLQFSVAVACTCSAGEDLLVSGGGLGWPVHWVFDGCRISHPVESVCGGTSDSVCLQSLALLQFLVASCCSSEDLVASEGGSAVKEGDWTFIGRDDIFVCCNCRHG